jgi:hypothetical protein
VKIEDENNPTRMLEVGTKADSHHGGVARVVFQFSRKSGENR